MLKRKLCPISGSTDDSETDARNVKRKKLNDDLEASDSVTVLTEALRSEEAGHAQKTSVLLRQFGSEYLHILDECFHIDCAIVLMRIGSTSKVTSTSYLSLRYIYCIFEKSVLKLELWEAIQPFLQFDSKSKENFRFNTSDYSLILNIFKLALCNGLLSVENVKKALVIARKCISSNDQTNRVAAVNFLVALISSVGSKSSSIEYRWLERLLCEMASDRDCRVRLAAMKGLLVISETNHSLTIDVYPLIKQLCYNSSKSVRIEALKILKNIALRHPEIVVKGRNDATLRLVDEAFAVVCHAVHDLEVTVRAEAARLLGDFQLVSDSFLDQTLDKKLLNSMQVSRMKNGITRGIRMSNKKTEKSSSSQWSTGKKLGEDVPMEKNEEEQLSVISTGACGAFVSALEDEFMIVRIAGVYSLGKLAADRPLFASIAIDHLADMFNDEIEQVRLDAVHALTPLIVHGVLEKEQLDTILTVLDDALPDSREALRKLLGKSVLNTPECLRYCLNSLLNCMKRFPIDRSSIYLCLSELGRKHATFVQSMVDELLEIHPVFDPNEPALENQVYLAKLIMVLNAASVHNPITSLLPKFAINHYGYLRCSMGELVPEITGFPTSEEKEKRLEMPPIVVNKKDVEKQISILLEKCYDMLLEASGTESYEQREVLREFISRDLNALCETGEKTTSTARFLAVLLKCFTKYDRLMQMVVFSDDSRDSLNIIKETLSSIDYAENSFCNVDKIIISLLAEYTLRLRYLKLAIESSCGLINSLLVREMLLCESEIFERRIRELNLVASGNIMKILSGVRDIMEKAVPKKAINIHFIFNLMHSFPVVLSKSFPSLSTISVKWAEIVEPSESVNEAIRFIAGLPMGIAVNIVLHNFHDSDIAKFRIKVEYPDQKFTLFKPRESDFTKVTPEKTRLLCNVLVHSDPWSEPANIEMKCVLNLSNVLQDFPISKNDSSEYRLVSVPDSPYFTSFASMNVMIYPMSNKTW